MYQPTTALRKIQKLKSRIRAVQGGTGASKTISILLYLINAAQSDKTPTITSVVSESVPHIKTGALRDFKNIMKAHNYWNDNRWHETDRIYTFETGSQMEFFGADPSNADKLRGSRRDRLFLNEANNVTLTAFDELEVRTKEYIFLDWNPVSEFWFYTDVLGKRDDVEHIVLNFQDNEAIPPEILKSIEQRKNREGWYKVFGLGLLGEVEGRIYTGWKIIDKIPHEARLERYGLDFGYTNDPTAIIALYYWNGSYILDEITYQKGLANKEIADILKNLPPKLVIADSAEPKSIDEIKSYGISILPTHKGKDSKKYGINVVQDQRVSMTKQSVNLIKEYRNYLWVIDKNGKMLNEAEDGNDHALDAIRYAICSLTPIITRKEILSQMPIIPERSQINPAV